MVAGPCDEGDHRQDRDRVGQAQGKENSATPLRQREGQPDRPDQCQQIVKINASANAIHRRLARKLSFVG